VQRKERRREEREKRERKKKGMKERTAGALELSTQTLKGLGNTPGTAAAYLLADPVEVNPALQHHFTCPSF